MSTQNKLGDTPLHNAAWKGHAAIVAMLLEKGELYNTIHDPLDTFDPPPPPLSALTGARKDIRNNEKQLPYDLSAKNPEVGRLLMHHSGEYQLRKIVFSFLFSFMFLPRQMWEGRNMGKRGTRTNLFITS